MKDTLWASRQSPVPMLSVFQDVSPGVRMSHYDQEAVADALKRAQSQMVKGHACSLPASQLL